MLESQFGITPEQSCSSKRSTQKSHLRSLNQQEQETRSHKLSAINTMLENAELRDAYAPLNLNAEAIPFVFMNGKLNGNETNPERLSLDPIIQLEVRNEKGTEKIQSLENRTGFCFKKSFYDSKVDQLLQNWKGTSKGLPPGWWQKEEQKTLLKRARASSSRPACIKCHRFRCSHVVFMGRAHLTDVKFLQHPMQTQEEVDPPQKFNDYDLLNISPRPYPVRSQAEAQKQTREKTILQGEVPFQNRVPSYSNINNTEQNHTVQRPRPKTVKPFRRPYQQETAFSKQKLVPISKQYRQMIQDRIQIYQDKESTRSIKQGTLISRKNHWKSPFTHRKEQTNVPQITDFVPEVYQSDGGPTPISTEQAVSFMIHADHLQNEARNASVNQDALEGQVYGKRRFSSPKVFICLPPKILTIQAPVQPRLNKNHIKRLRRLLEQQKQK